MQAQKSKILHVGYELCREEVLKILETELKEVDLYVTPQIYLAALYYKNKPQNDLKMWYDNKSRKNSTRAIVKGFYWDEKLKRLVLYIHIDGVGHYVVASRGKDNIPPITLKKHANEGQLGMLRQLVGQISCIARQTVA